MKAPRHLTIEEKRDWLADIFRDANGEYSCSDKFKAMVEDTKLALMVAEEQQAKKQTAAGSSILSRLPPRLNHFGGNSPPHPSG